MARSERVLHADRGGDVAGDGIAPAEGEEAGDRRELSVSIARALDLPHVEWHGAIPSTMDAAHHLAEQGAAAGTLVVADAQTRGRGRNGRRWISDAGAGLWMTLVERPVDASGLDVLSLRVGLHVARALDDIAGASIRLKWPNDLMLPDGKLGGILVEVRWREQRPEWVAIGIGINVRLPRSSGEASTRAAAALVADGRRGPDRLDVLRTVVPALRAAAADAGALRVQELQEFAGRDWARGRAVLAPHRGIVAGISSAGALLIETSGGTMACTSGSLVLEGETA
jgi:BirA family biotin operon repressor/biotin-[acetyl-CoA-carboxylase] ligase